MANYTRKQLRERWQGAKCVNLHESYKAFPIESEYIPGTWEVRIFPRWIFKRFLDRKIMEPLDSAIMSRNVSYDPDSGDTQEWGWYRWRYYFDEKEGCYVLKLDYDVEVEGKKALPLVRGILDIALVESATSIIGKFKWRIRWLRKIPILRRIPAVFLFYFEMEKLQIVQMSATARSNRREMPTPKPGYSSEYLELGRLRPIFPFPQVYIELPLPHVEEPKAEEPARRPEETRYARRRFDGNKWTKKDST